MIERSYDNIRTADEPQILYREIILTARIMDEIFAQIYLANEPHGLAHKPIASVPSIASTL